MKNTYIFVITAAALMGSQTFANEQFKASEYQSGIIYLGTGGGDQYETLVMDQNLTLAGGDKDYIDVYNGSKFLFEASGSTIFTVNIPGEELDSTWNRIFFHENDTYDISFDSTAQSIISSSPDFSLSLFTLSGKGIEFYGDSHNPGTTNLKLQNVEAGNKVSIDGVEYTYVGPKDDEYVFMQGEIGFTGYQQGSFAINLVAKAPAVPEPATGSLSLLALAGLCARRRRK